MENVDQTEIDKFSKLAARWWDPAGDFKTLHQINPIRQRYVENQVALPGLRVLDVGCGGGIFTESLSRAGAKVTAIDVSEALLTVAKLHAKESDLAIDYQLITAEALALKQPAVYDVVVCMEMVEHVPDPESLVQSLATLLKPGGHLFMSTINRNPKAYLFAILGAEYILGLLPKGTHDYQKFLKPSELAKCLRVAKCQLLDIAGLSYNPLTSVIQLSKDVSVNYFITAKKNEN